MAWESPIHDLIEWDLIKGLTRGTAEGNHHPDQFDVKVLGESVIVCVLPTSSAFTFAEYARDLFVPFAGCTLDNASGTDIVWDNFQPASLKESTRNKRGKGS